MIYAYTRLRYQVSVYRTIGPLVLCCATEILFLQATFSEMYTEFGKAGVRISNP